jgi:hypothetical protein
MLKMNSTGVQQPSHDTPNDREIERLREFTQTLPDRREFEQAPSPPSLPPHLLQVILNKDTPVSCDPNVLPEPNHVMLNHLYALSIKDGVMVGLNHSVFDYLCSGLECNPPPSSKIRYISSLQASVAMKLRCN